MKVLLYVVLAVILLLYLLYFVYFYLNQRAYLYPRQYIAPPGALPAVQGLEQFWLETSEGKVEAWYLSPLSSDVATPAPLLILAHGNGEIIDNWLAAVTTLRQMGFGVLLVEFPGYGRSAGAPTERSIRESYLLAYDTIIKHPQVDPQRIILFGHSLGGGAASILAAERPSKALILFSTFTSVRAIARDRMLPSFAALDTFDNLAAVRNYPHPVLIIHGKRDMTIPYHHALALAAAARQGQLVTLACGHGGCIQDWDRFWRELSQFFERAGVLK
jgi:uncharacterized protein